MVIVGDVNEVAVGVVAVKADDRLVFETDVLTVKAVSIVNVVGTVLLSARGYIEKCTTVITVPYLASTYVDNGMVNLIQ